MNIRFVSAKPKECFVRYYGLKDKKHKLKEIAEFYNCSTESIRQSIGCVIRRMGDLSNEEVNLLRNIINERQNNL